MQRRTRLVVSCLVIAAILALVVSVYAWIMVIRRAVNRDLAQELRLRPLPFRGFEKPSLLATLLGKPLTVLPLRASATVTLRSLSSAKPMRRSPGATAATVTTTAALVTSPPRKSVAMEWLLPMSHALWQVQNNSSAWVHSIDPVAITLLDPRRPGDEPRNVRLYCDIALLHMRVCTDVETAEQCILRIGPRALASALPSRCAHSEWFQGMIARDQDAPWLIEDSAEEYKYAASRSEREARGELPPPFHGNIGLIYAGQVMSSRDGTPYVDARNRVRMPMPQPWFSHRLKHLVYRLPMSIPEEAIVTAVERRKLFDFNPVLPTPFPFNDKSTYSFGRLDEVVAHELLARSYFAWTHRRGCWSAQRHLDILATGAVPVFIDLQLCHNLAACLPGYPVHLVAKARTLPGIDDLLTTRRSEFVAEPRRYYYHDVYNPIKPGVIDHTKFNKTEYFLLADQLLTYTRQYLTTRALAAYFLDVMGRPDARVVLMTANWWLPHTVGLMHGLASLGIRVLTPHVWGMSKLPFGSSVDDIERERRWRFFAGHRGAGFLYGLRAQRDMIFLCDRDVDCATALETGDVDVVAYCVSGTLNGAPYYDEFVRDNFLPGRVAFIDGLDQGRSFHREFKHVVRSGHVLFSREMPADQDDDQLRSPPLP